MHGERVLCVFLSILKVDKRHEYELFVTRSRVVDFKSSDWSKFSGLGLGYINSLTSALGHNKNKCFKVISLLKNCKL